MGEIRFKRQLPVNQLSEFVESFWMLESLAHEPIEVTVVPDSHVDISFAYTSNQPFHVTLNGLETQPIQGTLFPGTVIFSISFKLPALEFLIGLDIPNLINKSTALPDDFLGVKPQDMLNFERCCKKISDQLLTLIKPNVDTRKLRLFNLIYSSQGSLSVKEISEQVNWSSRQINRYFRQQFGLSLKAYCNILRFKASLPQLKAEKLYPERDFADQAHFIREVRKFSGVPPGKLSKNENDRFIQLSVLAKK